MSEISEMYAALNEQRKEKRAANRETTPALLEAKGVPFESKNGGAHLIVHTHTGLVDLWPGTGRWIVRSNKHRGFGVRKLFEYLRDHFPTVGSRQTDVGGGHD